MMMVVDNHRRHLLTPIVTGVDSDVDEEKVKAEQVEKSASKEEESQAMKGQEERGQISLRLTHEELHD